MYVVVAHIYLRRGLSTFVVRNWKKTSRRHSPLPNNIIHLLIPHQHLLNPQHLILIPNLNNLPDLGRIPHQLLRARVQHA